MANELTTSYSHRIANGGFSDEVAQENVSITQSTVGAKAGIVSVGTSEEDLDIGDVATPGWLYFKNLDSTNYVEWGGKAVDGTMTKIGRLKPGEFAAFRMAPSSATLRLKANTAAVKVHVKLLND